MDNDPLDDAAQAEADAAAPVVEGEIVDAEPAAEPAAADDLDTRTLVYLLLRQGFDILAPAWAVTDGEIGQLTDVYDPLLRKYFPDLSRFGPELAAVLVTAAVLLPRLGTPRAVPAEAPDDDDAGAAPA